MAEEQIGNVLRDENIITPSIEDFYYNSLYVVDQINKADVKSFYYLEQPPGGSEALGFDTGDFTGSIFSIKTSKKFAKIDGLSVLTGKIDGQTLSFSAGGCNVKGAGKTNLPTPSNPNGLIYDNQYNVMSDYQDINQNFLYQLVGTNNVKSYLVKTQKDENDKASMRNYLSANYEQLLNATLMFTNSPRLPYYSIELLKKDDVRKTTFVNLVQLGANNSLLYSPTVPEFMIDEAGNRLKNAAVEYKKKTGHYCKSYNDNDEVSYDGKRQVWYIRDYKVADTDKNYYDSLDDAHKAEILKKEKEGYAYYYVLHRYAKNNNSGASFSAVSPLSYEIRDEVLDLISNSTDIRICVSTNILNDSNKQYLTSYPERYVNPTGWELIKVDLCKLYNAYFDERTYAHTGFNLYGQDSFGRIIAVVYILKDGQWINLNKYIISKLVENGIASNSNMLEANMANEAFKPWTYNLAYSTYQDNFWTQSETKWKQDTRRKKLQMEIFKESGSYLTCDNDLYTQTVSIGDVSFFVPPTSIRTVTQTNTDRTPLIRARGTAAKNIEKATTQLEIDLYFNDAKGINGYPYKMDLWEAFDETVNGFTTSSKAAAAEGKKDEDGKITYYMNGLRALLSEFKFTPFLPIVNKYINETLKITGVALSDLSISTVPNFPKLLKATLVLQDFDYQILMPEIPAPFYRHDEKTGEETEFVNPFALCINYDVMRYYYQKALIKGNELANKLTDSSGDYPVNSLSFIAETTFSNRSAFMPCKFEDPEIEIFVPDENYLNRLLSVKMNAVRKAASGAAYNFIPSANQSEAIRRLGDIYEVVSKVYGTLSNPAEAKKKNETIGQELLKYKNGISTYTDDEGNEHTVNYGEPRDYIKDIKIGSQVEVTIDLGASIDEIKDIFEEATASYLVSAGMDNDSAKEQSKVDLDKIFPGGKFFISCDKNRDKTLDQFYSILKWANEKGNELIDANLEAIELKEASDWESIHSLMYNKVASIRVDQFQAVMKNTFAGISTLESSGKAMQHIGGSDIHIIWSMTTTNKDIADICKELPEYEAYCMRKYHVVLPSFPIRISSEFTRLLGVYEVSIEHVTVQTTPNFPGVYQITINAVSTDRTIRNREALKSIANQDDYTGNGSSGVLSNSFGLAVGAERTQINIRQYSELNDMLAAAEVYPDLELPKIGELGEKGFKFLRYKEKERQRNDLYVDPDFYFYYTQVLMSESLKAVMKMYCDDSIPDDEKAKFRVTDTTGAQLEYGWDGIDFEKANNIVKARLEERNKEKATTDVTKTVSDDEIDATNNIVAMQNSKIGHWNISPKITTSFSETNWLNVLQKKDKYNNLDKEISSEDSNISAVDMRKEQTVKGDKEKAKKLDEFYQEKLESIDKGLTELSKYLEENPIGGIDLASINEKATVKSLYDQYNRLTDIESYNVFLGKIKGYLKQIYALDNDNEIDSLTSSSNKTISNMLDAAFAANTAPLEYNPANKTEPEDWQGRIITYGTCEVNGKYISASYDTKISELKEAGIYKIKKMPYNMLFTYLTKDEKAKFIADISSNGPLENKNFYVLDPYYRKHPELSSRYLAMCSVNEHFAKHAYMRLVIWWMIRLYKMKLYPSLISDVLRKQSKENSKNDEKIKKLLADNDIKLDTNSTFYSQIKSFGEKNGISLDAGKFFTSILLLQHTDGINDNYLYNMIVARDYNGLNEYLHNLVSQTRPGNVSADEVRIRKFLMALVGYGEIKSADGIGYTTYQTTTTGDVTKDTTDIQLKCNETPKKFLLDSFYSMIRNDYRGRMLRAFPTFHIIMIDEGREVGLYKLHSNFYSINAISDITIAKSRKIPADTCTLQINNNYSTFVTDDEDSSINYKANLGGEFWEDILSRFTDKYKYAKRLDKRKRVANRVNRAKLSPGIQISVRMGYGSDARNLPCCFNGIISQITPNTNVISVVAQGFGYELTNPIMEDMDADQVQYKDIAGEGYCGRYGASATPRTIINSFLTTESSAMSKYAKGLYGKKQWFFQDTQDWEEGSDLTAGEVFLAGTAGITEATLGGIPGAVAVGASAVDLLGNVPVKYLKENIKIGWVNALSDYIKAQYQHDNPYGIVHFGDKYFYQIFYDGEVVQNIYEAGKMTMPASVEAWSQMSFDKMQMTPKISFNIKNKTMWDVLHICRSVQPNYIVGITDFGFRSTIFYGAPHYYYAYDYEELYDGSVIEKRMPYQQWHYYLSTHDIISNNITADSTNIKTVATGMYKYNVAPGDEIENRSIGPLYVDKSIYPEYLRSTIVNTSLHIKSLRNYTDAPRAKRRERAAGMIGINAVSNAVGNGLHKAQQKNIIIPSIQSMQYGLKRMVGSPIRDEGYLIGWTTTADALKESVKEMYQGGIVVIGDSSVKPQDRIAISDSYNYMQGQMLVRDVVHNLNMQTGYTTTINVDCISTVNDELEIMKQNQFWSLCGMAFRFTATASAGAVLGIKAYNRYKGIEPDIENAVKSTEALEAGSEEKSLIQLLKEYLKSIGKSIKEYSSKGKEKFLASDIWKILKENKIFRFISNVTKLMAKGLSFAKASAEAAVKLGIKLVNALKAMPFVSKLLGFLSGPIGWILLGIDAITMLGSYVVDSLIYDEIKNRKVVTVFPIKRYGIPYTSGLDGSVGSVYGATSWGQLSTAEKLATEYLMPAANGEDSWVQSFLTNFIFSEDTINLVANLQRDSKAYMYANKGNNTDEEIFKNNAVESRTFNIASSPAFAGSKDFQNAYVLSGIKRAKANKNDKESIAVAKTVMQNYYIENISKILNNSGHKSHIPIRYAPSLQRFLNGDNAILCINHEMLKQGEKTASFNTIYQGRNINIKARVETEPVYTNTNDGLNNNGLVSINEKVNSNIKLDKNSLPAYNNAPWIAINNNVPEFTAEEIEQWQKWKQTAVEGKPETYSSLTALDSLGRQGPAIMMISTKSLYIGARESLSSYNPPGMEGNNNRYSFISGGSIYHRTHLLGYKLSCYGLEPRNLTTGTNYCNEYGMGPFENALFDYIVDTTKGSNSRSILYKVEPIYEGNNLVPTGIQMQARSMDDGGKAISFNIYCFNVQPHIKIYYETGKNEYSNADTISDKELNDGSSTEHMQQASSKTKTVYDVPFLHEEAVSVLTDICEAALESVYVDNKTDFTNVKEKLNGSKIVVVSALKVNSNYMNAGAGYVFTLQGTGKFAGDNLFTIINNIHDDITEKIKSINIYSKSPTTKQEVVTSSYDIPAFEVNKTKSGEVRVTVLGHSIMK